MSSYDSDINDIPDGELLECKQGSIQDGEVEIDCPPGLAVVEQEEQVLDIEQIIQQSEVAKQDQSIDSIQVQQEIKPKSDSDDESFDADEMQKLPDSEIVPKEQAILQSPNKQKQETTDDDSFDANEFANLPDSEVKPVVQSQQPEPSKNSGSDESFDASEFVKLPDSEIISQKEAKQSESKQETAPPANAEEAAVEQEEQVFDIEQIIQQSEVAKQDQSIDPGQVQQEIKPKSDSDDESFDADELQKLPDSQIISQKEAKQSESKQETDTPADAEEEVLDIEQIIQQSEVVKQAQIPANEPRIQSQKSDSDDESFDADKFANLPDSLVVVEQGVVEQVKQHSETSESFDAEKFASLPDTSVKQAEQANNLHSDTSESFDNEKYANLPDTHVKPAQSSSDQSFDVEKYENLPDTVTINKVENSPKNIAKQTSSSSFDYEHFAALPDSTQVQQQPQTTPDNQEADSSVTQDIMDLIPESEQITAFTTDYETDTENVQFQNAFKATAKPQESENLSEQFSKDANSIKQKVKSEIASLNDKLHLIAVNNVQQKFQDELSIQKKIEEKLAKIDMSKQVAKGQLIVKYQALVDEFNKMHVGMCQELAKTFKGSGEVVGGGKKQKQGK